MSLPSEVEYSKLSTLCNLNGFAFYIFSTKIEISKEYLKSNAFQCLSSEFSEPLVRITLALIKIIESKKEYYAELFITVNKVTKMQRFTNIFNFLCSRCLDLNSENNGIEGSNRCNKTQQIYKIWYITVQMEFIYPLTDYQLRKRVENYLETIINEESDLIFLSDVRCPKPFWVKNSIPPTLIDKDYQISQFVLDIKSEFSEIIEVIRNDSCWSKVNPPLELDHYGIIETVLILISLIITSLECFSSHVNLLVVQSTSDIFVVLDITARYLDFEISQSNTEEEYISVLEQYFIYKNERNYNDRTEGYVIIPISTVFLQSRRIKILLHEIASNWRISPSNRCKVMVLVIATDQDLYKFSEDLSSLIDEEQEATTIAFSSLSSEKHMNFVSNILENTNDNYLDEVEKEKTADFIVYAHETVIKETQKRRKQLLCYEHPSVDFLYPLPSVGVLSEVVHLALCIYKSRRDKIIKELESLTCAIEKSGSMISYLDEMKQNLLEILSIIENSTKLTHVLTTEVKQKKEQIDNHEQELEKFRQQLSAAVEAEEEMALEVSEYVAEIYEPLKRASEELVEIDMERVKKLVARSPLTAVQLVFESGVSFLTSEDITWKSVRHATNDDTFFERIAALDIPSLSPEQIAGVVERLQQIKITEEHMARMSDIGSILFRYLKTAVFLWKRFHEDIKPRQERVEALRENTKELRRQINDVEEAIKTIRQDLQLNSSTVKQEEEKYLALSSQKSSLEKDLQVVETVIEKLNPHIERWNLKLQGLKSKLNHVKGNSLFEAAQISYLAPIPSEIRVILEESWRLKLEESVFEIGKLTKEECEYLFDSRMNDTLTLILDYYKTLPVVITDANYTDLYFKGLKRFYLESDDWKNHLKEFWADVVSRGLSNCGIVVQGGHDKFYRFLQWWHSTTSNLKFSEGEFVIDSKHPHLICALEDHCPYLPCKLCSTHKMINLSYSNKQLGNIFGSVLLKNWHSSGSCKYNELEAALRDLRSIGAQKEEAERTFMQELAKHEHLRSLIVLDNVSESADSLNKLSMEKFDLRNKISELQEEIRKNFLGVSKYAAVVYHLLHILKKFSPYYAIHPDVLKEAFVQAARDHCKMATLVDFSESEMKRVVIISVFKLLQPRLKFEHRLIVGVILLFANLPSNYNCNTLSRAFLEPIDDSILWNEILDQKYSVQSKVKNYSSDSREEIELKKEEWEDLLKNTLFARMLEVHFVCEDQMDSKASEIDSDISKEKNDKDGIARQRKFEEIKNKFDKLQILCDPLFQEITNLTSESELMKWLLGKLRDLPLINDREEDLLTCVRKLILIRHFQPDLLLTYSEKMMADSSVDVTFKPSKMPLKEAVEQCSLLPSEVFEHHKNLIRISFSPSLRPDLFIMLAASNFGIKQYKINHISLLNVTKENLQLQSLKTSRRKTWLVIHDTELVPDGYRKVQNMLRSIPEDLSPPLVFCPSIKVATSSQKVDFSGLAGVLAVIEDGLNFEMSLKFLENVFRCLLESSASRLYFPCDAICIAISFVHALCCARQNYNNEGWVYGLHITEEDFRCALEAASYFSSSSDDEELILSTLSLSTISKAITEVYYKNVVPYVNDKKIIDDMLSTYISAAMLCLGESNKSPQHNAVKSSKGFNLFEVLLSRSSLTEKISLLLENEEVFLHLEKHMFDQNQNRKIINCLQVYKDSDFVEVPIEIVTHIVTIIKKIIEKKLDAPLENGNRQRDHESVAWEAEIDSWNILCEALNGNLLQILRVSSKQYLTPANILYFLVDHLRHIILPSGAYSMLEIETDIFEYESKMNQNLRLMIKKNLICSTVASRFVSFIRLSLEHLQARREHLQFWCESESPPVQVNLGLLQRRDYWLCQFRRGVCNKAHWNLKGSLLYVYPSTETLRNERPPQGIYLLKCSLIGGSWREGKIYHANETRSPLSLVLAVGHSKPIPQSDQIWVPVLDPQDKENVFLEALMTVDRSFSAPKELLHIALTC